MKGYTDIKIQKRRQPYDSSHTKLEVGVSGTDVVNPTHHTFHSHGKPYGRGDEVMVRNANEKKTKEKLKYAMKTTKKVDASRVIKNTLRISLTNGIVERIELRNS